VIEKESFKIKELEQIQKQYVSFSGTRASGTNCPQALFLQSLAAPVSPGS
jgi:hypothetical protein